MVTIENNGGKNRIPFSQRLFWSIFFMFLGIVFCFLLFQYQREKEFAQEKLSTLLDNYNYLLYKKCQKETDLPSTVRGFIEDIPQRDLRVTIIAPNGEVLFDNAETEGLSNHNDRSEVQKPGSAARGSRSAPHKRPASAISTRRPTSTATSTAPRSGSTPTSDPRSPSTRTSSISSS